MLNDTHVKSQHVIKHSIYFIILVGFILGDIFRYYLCTKPLTFNPVVLTMNVIAMNDVPVMITSLMTIISMMHVNGHKA